MRDYFCGSKKCDYLEKTGTGTHFCPWVRCPYGQRLSRPHRTAPQQKQPRIEPADEAYIARMNELNRVARWHDRHVFTRDDVMTIYRERSCGMTTRKIADSHGWKESGVKSVCYSISHGGEHYRTLVTMGIDVRSFGGMKNEPV